MKGVLKFLNMEIIHHPLIEDGVCFSTIASSRVLSDNTGPLTHLYSNIYTNNLMAICGKNATGKTTILRLLIGMLSLLTSDTSIQNTELRDLLFGHDDITIAMYFYSEDHFIYKDIVTFSLSKDKWEIKEEDIYCKRLTVSMAKKNIFLFDDSHLLYSRGHLSSEMKALLQSTNSLFRIVSKDYITQKIYDTLLFTDVNVLDFSPKDDIPSELLEFLDPTIDYFKIEIDEEEGNKILYRLKFKGSDREISDFNFVTLMKYLSSGTVKAITLFAYMVNALKDGGILFVDEIENHFNHGIIKEFIEIFSNKVINKNGATLILTTHFSELLNSFRADSIYITNKGRVINSKKYSDFVDIRPELSKRDVFDTGYGGLGTAINYQSIQRFESALKKEVNNE